jgi:hypothetical protein
MDAEKEDKIIARILGTPDGKELMAILSERFFDKSVYVLGDPYHTAYQAGQQDVIGFLRESEREGRKKNDTAKDFEIYPR